MSDAPDRDGLYRLGHFVDGTWAEHTHERVYLRHPLDGGGERVVAAAPGGDPLVLRSLAEALSAPFRLLYVLYQPRGESAPGRFESPDLSPAELDAFFERFGDFLRRDSRFDLWVLSPAGRAAVIWDRHDLIWCYGPPEAFETRLRALGFAPGEPSIPSPHRHYEHYALRKDAEALVHFFDWRISPLLRGDIE